jgi:GTPase SAR1 family protein
MIFVVNLGGFSGVLFEDKTKLRMQESLDLFRATLENKTFYDIPVFLFFNKKDLFDEMIKVHPITSCFPSYTGPNADSQQALQYIIKQFQEVVPQGKTNFTTHILSACERKEVKETFGQVAATLSTNNKRQ